LRDEDDKRKCMTVVDAMLDCKHNRLTGPKIKEAIQEKTGLKASQKFVR
jgi:hypothetical protein